MGYRHIDNLYKNQEILMFRECFALEKIHGRSAHIKHSIEHGIRFFSGGEKHDKFVELFEKDALVRSMSGMEMTVYGEAYGGKRQGMSKTYGPDLKFVAFEVLMGDHWLSVPAAHEVTAELGLEFVDYVKIPTDLDAINEQRDRESVQAIRNGMGKGGLREGVVLRPLIELTKNNGSRICAKHKRDEFKETKTPRKVSPEKLQLMSDAAAIAEEWVTPMRLAHVLDKLEGPAEMKNMRNIIAAMEEDVQREGAGEVEWNSAVRTAIGRSTALLMRKHVESKMVDS